MGMHTNKTVLTVDTESGNNMQIRIYAINMNYSNKKHSIWNKIIARLSTFVSSEVVILYLLSTSIRAILASRMASLIPMQLRGPRPNGKWEQGWRLATADGKNLHT